MNATMTNATINPVRLEDVLVVKLGGGAGLDMARCLQDVVTLAQQRPLVLLHGISDAVNRLCAERGLEVRTIVSPNGHESRYTDPATRALYVEAVERVNSELCATLNAHGVRAVGVHNALRGERKGAIRGMVNGRVLLIRDDYSGSITGVDADAILRVLSEGDVPIVSPMAWSDADGYLNVDGDRASASVASAIGASELVILSNVRGLYRQYPDESSLVACVPQAQLEQALAWAQGRMKRKVLGAQEALRGGVRRVIIADGRADAPLLGALHGVGTRFEA